MNGAASVATTTLFICHQTMGFNICHHVFGGTKLESQIEICASRTRQQIMQR